MSKKIDEVVEDKFELTDVQEEYIKIYHEYFVLKWSWIDLCKRHNCSKMKISKAINWVIDNRINIPSAHLIKGAIDTIQERLKVNQEMLNTEIAKKRYRDNNFIVALTREIREDEKSIYKLQEVTKDESEDKNNISAAQVLALIHAEQASNKSTTN